MSWIARNYFTSFLLVIGCQLQWSDAACSTATATLAGAHAIQVIANEITVFVCSSDGNAPYNKFDTGDAAITLYCKNGVWQTSTATCGTSQVTECAAPLDAKTDATFSLLTSTNVAGKMECTATGTQWMSGELARVSQCRDGNWVPIIDECDADCPLPRDCKEVQDLGFTANDDYFVVPSGRSSDTPIGVTCLLSDTDAEGGGWTQALFNTAADMPDDAATDSYDTGINSIATGMFLGLQHLHDLTHDNNGADLRPHTLKIVLSDDNGDEYYAYYDNFTVGSSTDSYALTSLGTYHGDAGDALCPHVFTPFSKDSSNIGWWGDAQTRDTLIEEENGCILTKSPLIWRPLTKIGMTLQGVAIWIRPTEFDKTVACPLMTGVEPYWNSTEGSFPSRSVGSTITYKCLMPYFMEPLTDTDEGTSTCEAGPPLAWNPPIKLPCIMKCPTDFHLAENGLECYHASTETVTGFHQATLKCLDLDATPAFIKSSVEVKQIADPGTYYFTGHKYAEEVPVPPELINDTHILSDPALTSVSFVEPNNCVAINGDAFYKPVNCNDEVLNYMCIFPAQCVVAAIPSFDGACVFPVAATSFAAGITECRKDISGLAHPMSYDHLAKMYLALAESGLYMPNTPYYIGLHKNPTDGKWDSGGYFPDVTDAELSTDLASANEQYIIWTYDNVTDVSSIEFAPWEANTAQHVLCQYGMPFECRTAPPLPSTNMGTSNATSREPLTENRYWCDTGYFFDGNITLPAEVVSTCRGALGEWVPTAIPACTRVAVCEGDVPMINNSLVTNVTDENTFYLNGVVTYNCPAGVVTNPSKFTQQNLTCTNTSDTTYGFSPTYEDCTVCDGEPSVANTTTDWVDLATVVVATCIASHEVSFNVTVQTIECTSSGWNMTNILPCKKACVDDAPAPVLKMTPEVPLTREVGKILTYTCETGFFFVYESGSSIDTVAASKKVECDATGAWVTDTTSDCRQACLTDPPPKPATSDWSFANNVTSTHMFNETTVTYSCPTGQLWGNKLDAIESVCLNGAWTPLDTTIAVCTPACLTDPPAAIGGANRTWDGKPGFQGEKLNYTCPEGQATVYDEEYTSLTCSNGEWIPTDTMHNMTTLADTFLCKPACPGPPVVNPVRSEYNFTVDRTEGAVVEYFCEGYFTDGNQSIINVCENGNWTVSTLPNCLTVTSSGPTTSPPYVWPTLPPQDEEYPLTTDFYMGLLQSEMITHDGKVPDYTSTDSLLGFGYGVKLEKLKNQCLKRIFNDTSKTPDSVKCMQDPSTCMTVGFTISIWQKRTFNISEFDRLDIDAIPVSEYQYIVSTGGDEKGHVGFSWYHVGMFEVAIVSNGTHYWKVITAGMQFDSVWNNIGVRFSPQETEDPERRGLSIFRNTKMYAIQRDPMPSNVAAKPGLDPGELIIGCHKTSSNQQYRNFADQEFDELAMWDYALPQNKTNFLLGSYRENFTHLSPQVLNEILDRSNLADEEQMFSALAVASAIADVPEKPTSAPTVVDPTSSVVQNSPTPTGPNQVASLTTEESVEMQESLIEIFYKFTNMKNLAKSEYSYESGVGYLGLIKLASSLLDISRKPEWDEIQKNGSSGAAAVMERLEEFTREAFCRIKFKNGTKPIQFLQKSKNILFFGNRFFVEDFMAKGPLIEEPDWNNAKYKELREEWDHIFDRVRVPTNLMNDVRCNRRPMCFVVFIYDTYDKLGPVPIDTSSIPEGAVHKMGSRMMSQYVKADRAKFLDGTFDTTAPLCEVDEAILQKNFIFLKFENREHILALRDLQFHSDEVVTDIEERRCALWNKNLSDFGAWDASKCSVYERSSTYTKCSCTELGKMVILTEMVPPAEVPDEEYWLTITKYIFYGISIILLILYSLVVIYSSDLKEQFHLMGMNLSLAVLFGSISMIVSDFDSIRDDRHLCTTLSTLIHFFYVAAGAWVSLLGFASFQAITKGIVGGKFAAYALIAWGSPLISVGVPYAFFIRDLGTDPRCFVAWENYAKAAFFIPQMFHTVCGLFFGIVVICNLSTPALRKENLIDDYGSFCRGAAFVLIYFGFTWIFGLLAYMRFGFTDPDFFPMFQITNSLTGIIIFIFIGLGSTRYRTVLAGKAKARREKILSLNRSKSAPGKKNKLKDDEDEVEDLKEAKESDKDRPDSSDSLRPPTRGQVAGRPGSRPVTPL